MNTAVELFDWIWHNQNENGRISEQLPCRVELSSPGLVPCSDSENSSLEDADTSSMCSSTMDGCSTTHSVNKRVERQLPRRRVSFHQIEVREYSITVGDHPFCYDGLPLSLDWEHTDEVTIRDINSSRERKSHYRAPRRLSFDERRDRLFNVSSESDGSEQSERKLELSMIIKMLHNSWSMNSILPPPRLYDIDEEEREEEREAERRRRKAARKQQQVQQQTDQVIEWKRVLRRSNAFSE